MPVNRRTLLLSTLCTSLVSNAFAATSAQHPENFSRFFSEADATGTIVVKDARRTREVTFVHDASRAERRYTPASTFKIPHSLFALDAGVLQDEFQQIPWDGLKRAPEAWNADQDLRSAMRNSTVWVYERFAQQIGMDREMAYLRRINYGNAVVTGAKPFWVEGELAISASEQVAFLSSLYRNQLPFALNHQRLVKDVMIMEAGKDWILRGKTGWSGKIGWWVGWVEWPSGPVFFALNIDTPNRLGDLSKRIDITKRILRSIDALPRG
uniref:class D beta-lactamase n=1 Tax=Polaromonas sp. TaxID=1869339 RepID=UPI0015EF82C1|nr:class D beta-lactamase [Polaromonas sp.]